MPMTIEQMQSEMAKLQKTLKLTDAGYKREMGLVERHANTGYSSSDLEHDKPIRAEIKKLQKAIADAKRKAELAAQQKKEKEEAEATVTDDSPSTLKDAMASSDKKKAGATTKDPPMPDTDPGPGKTWKLIDPPQAWKNKYWKAVPIEKKDESTSTSRNPGKRPNLASVMKGNRSYA